MIEKEFIPHQESVELKEIGFNEPCFGYRDGENYLMIQSIPHCVISAPTFSQAFRWFREKYGLLSYVDKCLTDTFRYNIDWDDSIIGLSGHPTYEEAELACLRKLIEMVKGQI